jgi:hypothetical protein
MSISSCKDDRSGSSLFLGAYASEEFDGEALALALLLLVVYAEDEDGIDRELCNGFRYGPVFIGGGV